MFFYFFLRLFIDLIFVWLKVVFLLSEAYLDIIPHCLHIFIPWYFFSFFFLMPSIFSFSSIQLDSLLCKAIVWDCGSLKETRKPECNMYLSSRCSTKSSLNSNVQNNLVSILPKSGLMKAQMCDELSLSRMIVE